MVKGSYAEDQGAIAAIQVLEQQYQQNTRGRTGRPHRPVEHLMVAGEVAVIAATHDPQRRGHRALAWRQYRAHQQHLRFAPGWVAEQRCEGNENGYNGIGQGEHGWTFRRKWGQAILPCPYSFPKKCAKSSLDDVARLVRRLKDVPPPGEQRADPDTFSGAFLTNIIHALEINLYGALVNREPVPDYLRSTTEKAHATATTIAEALPARVKRTRQ